MTKKLESFFDEGGEPTRKTVAMGMILVATTAALILAGMFHTTAKNEAAKDRLHKMVEYIIHASDTVLVLLDDASKIETLNEKFLVLSGYSAKDLVGQPITALIPMRHQNTHNHSYSTRLGVVKEKKQHFETILECTLLCKDKTEKPVVARIYVTPDGFSLAMLTSKENTTIESIAVNHAASQISKEIGAIEPKDVKAYLERQLQTTPADVLKKLEELEWKMDKLIR